MLASLEWNEYIVWHAAMSDLDKDVFLRPMDPGGLFVNNPSLQQKSFWNTCTICWWNLLKPRQRELWSCRWIYSLTSAWEFLAAKSYWKSEVQEDSCANRTDVFYEWTNLRTFIRVILMIHTCMCAVWMHNSTAQWQIVELVLSNALILTMVMGF